MDRDVLEKLLRGEESDRIELTISANDSDKFGEVICAFSNDMAGQRLPGYIFVGARPDGSASGLSITDRLLQNLAAFRSDGNILPPPRMKVQQWSLGGGEMAVIEVFPSDLPPVRYKNVVWIRTGPRRARASEVDERALSERRAALARTWDARPCNEAGVEDLVLDLFTLNYRNFAIDRSVIAENHRTIEDQLSALRFYDRRAQRPTHAGVLLFARDSRYYVPGAYAQYVRYDGQTQAADVLRERELAGDLGTVMRELDSLARELAGQHPVQKVEGLSERAMYEYPPNALHELFMNAVIHRSYESNTPIMINHFSDRVELTNPGGLYGDLSPDDFPGATAYRNPVLAEAAKVLGFVNKFGRGIARVQAELERNGSPPAEFTPHRNHFMVIVRGAR